MDISGRHTFTLNQVHPVLRLNGAVVTVIETELLVAGLPEVQAMLEVSTQDTASR
jgi:hypothetical protein